MRKTFFTLFLLSFPIFGNLNAQLENSIWYFGATSGINFPSGGGAPTQIPTSPARGAFTGGEGCGVATNPISGAVMFYTDGISIFNANNQMMVGQPTSGLGGCNSSAQAVAFCKVPDKCNQYYVFANGACSNTNLYAYIVDMNLQGGLGEVLDFNLWDWQGSPVPSSNILHSGISESMTIIPIPGTPDFWLVGRIANQTTMFSFKIDASFRTNFDNAPLTSTSLNIATSTSYNMEYCANASSILKNVAIAYPNAGKIYTLGFDVSTGLFSNGNLLNDNVGGVPYDVEWSPNGEMLYYSTYTNFIKLVQDDLSGTVTDIYTFPGQNSSGGGLKTGPDGKIYFIYYRGYNNLGVVNNPDSPGLNCNYSDLDFPGNSFWDGLNLPVTLPPATITNDYTHQMCAGTSGITLTESVAPNQTIQWLPATGLSATNTASVLASPTVTTIYYAVITDANGCETVNRHTVELVQNNITNLAVSNNSATPLCPGEPITLNVTGTNVDFYSISPGSFPNFTSSISLNPQATTNYTITAHQSVCTSTIQITVNVANCLCSGGIELTPAVLSSYTVGSVINVPINGTYVINQSMTLPNTVNIQNSEIKIAPNVEITVPSGEALNIFKSHLYACTNMWQGIKVVAGGEIKIEGTPPNGKPSLIEDAIIAVDFFGSDLNRSLAITNSVFNKNQTDVQIDGYYPTQNNYNIIIENSVFTCREFNIYTAPYSSSTLTLQQVKANYSFLGTTNLEDQQIPETSFSSVSTNAYLKAPFAGTKSTYGLVLKTVGVTANHTDPNTTYKSATIGNPNNTNLYNIFDNHVFGIYAIRSNLVLTNNRFQNIINWQSTSTNAGKGIYALHGLFSKNKIIVEKSFFTNCNYGLDISNYFDINVNNNTFKSTQDETQNYVGNHIGLYGAKINSYQYKNIRVNNNIIYNTENGIVFNGGLGIYNNGSGFQNNAQYSGQIDIQSNTIQPEYAVNMGSLTNQYVRYAIIANNIVNSTTTNVTGTTLNINNNSLSKVNQGIQVMNWRKNIVMEDNAVVLRLSSLSAFEHAGILYNNNLNSTTIKNRIQRNTVTGFGLGTVNSFGIKYSVSTNTNVYCNTVSNTYRGLSYSGSSAGTVNKRNKLSTHKYGFVLDGTGTAIGQQGSMILPADNEFNGAWPNGINFMTVTMNTASPLGNQMYVHNAAPFNPNLSSTTVFSAIPYSNNTTPQTIIYSIGLYQNCPAVMLAQNGNSDLLDIRENIKKRLNGEIPIVVNPLEGDYNSKKQIYTLLKNDNLLSLGDADLENFVVEQENNNHGKLERIQKNLAEGNKLLASAELMTLDPNAIDENFKQFDEIYLSYLDDSLNTNDSLNLIVLGNKCPVLDGSVVYQARALFGALFGYNYIFTDGCPKYGDDNEKSLVQNENTSTQTFEKNEIAVYPNPNNGKFYIQTKDIKFIQIFDLQGRVIQFSQNKIDDQAFEIEIEAENGMYNVQIINANTIQNVKIKVLK